MKKYSATLIGLLFTVICFLATRTFIIPIVTIMPAATLLESLFENIFGTNPFDAIGQSILITLTILFLLTTWLYYILLLRQLKKNKTVNTWLFIAYLVVQLFIIHPLGFYLYMSTNWSMANDGQLMFGVIETFPISSLAFVVLGLLTTIIANHKLKQYNPVT